LVAANHRLDRLRAGSVHSNAGHFLPVPFTYIVVAFCLSLGLRAIYRRLWRTHPPLWKVGLLVLIGSFVAAYLWLLISSVTFWLRRIWPWPQQSAAQLLLDTLVYTLEHHKPFLFLSWSALYFGIKYWQQQRADEARALRDAALAKESELRMLRYQLNPHFLFNSLNSAAALVREDPADAERMLNELSDFLRYSLTHAQPGEVSLREELEAVRRYLAIEQIRFEEKLVVEFDIASAAETFRVPSLLVQPLIENAVKYGWQTSPLPLRLGIKACTTEQQLRLEISNTGKWIEPANNNHNGHHIGLDNVRRRLEQAFPQRHRFDIGGRDGRVVVTLELEPSR
jgi:LytS/YehU family sensor histidine kinase